MLRYKGYLAQVEFDEETQAFSGQVVNIQHSISFYGPSALAVHKAFEEAVEAYVDACRVRGEEPEQPVTGRYTLHLSPEQYRRVLRAGELLRRSLQTGVAEVFHSSSEFHKGSPLTPTRLYLKQRLEDVKE